jgi:hypothetical protein
MKSAVMLVVRWLIVLVLLLLGLGVDIDLPVIGRTDRFSWVKASRRPQPVV